MTWEIEFGLLLIVAVIAFGAWGAWKTRDRDL